MSVSTTNNISHVRPEAIKQPEAFTAWKTQMSANTDIRSIWLGIQNSPRQSFHTAAKLGWVAQAYSHIVHGADPNAQDDKEKTPLHWAIVRGDINIIRALLASGANPHAEDLKGMTPLRIALDPHGLRKDTIQALLDARVDPNIVLAEFEPLIGSTKSEHERELFQEIIGCAQQVKKRKAASAFVFVNETSTTEQAMLPIKELVKLVGEHILS